MKNIRTKLSAALVIMAGLALGSCSEDFLDVSSKTEPNTGNYYKTESQAWRALLGCYDGWRQISSTNGGYPFYIASTIMGDECYGGAGAGDDWKGQVIDRFDQTISGSETNIYSDFWKASYAAIYRCNMLINAEEAITWNDESKHSLYMAEAKALRALTYFDLVRMFGNIPLFLEASTENREQTEPSKVYSSIFDDLRYAIDNIPADAYTDAASHGHITRYAAEAIFARAYLFYSGYYGADPAYSDGRTISHQDALAAVEDVIASQRFSLVPEFKNLWPAASLVAIPDAAGWDADKSTYAGDANSEVVLAQLFTPTQDYDGNNDANRWLVNIGLRNLNSTPYGKGWGFCTVSPVFFRTNFVPQDLRRTASVIEIETEKVDDTEGFEASVNDWREYTGLCVKKYTPMVFGNGKPATSPDGSADFMINNAQPWVIVRYSDVLLMAAELGSSNAASYMHMIRSRAGLPDVSVSKQSILDERARELAFEGVRYWDLLRQGVEVMANAVVASGGNVMSGGHASTVTYNRDRIIATKGLSQIPLNQITLSNGVLKQNAGWY